MALIALERVSFGYPERPVLADLDDRVHPTDRLVVEPQVAAGQAPPLDDVLREAAGVDELIV